MGASCQSCGARNYRFQALHPESERGCFAGYGRLKPSRHICLTGKNCGPSISTGNRDACEACKEAAFHSRGPHFGGVGSAMGYAVVTQRNLFCFSLTAHGLLQQMTVADLTRMSDTILMGTVARVGPSWQTTSGWVFTSVTVNASKYLKNPMSQVTVQLRIQGGSTTCGGLIVEDQPSFVKGTSSSVLGDDQLQESRQLSCCRWWSQGKYTVENGSAWWGDPSNAVPLDDLIAEINRNL